VEAAIADLDEPAPPPGVTIEEVSDEGGYRLWAKTVREIYGLPEAAEAGWVEPAAGFFSTPDGQPLHESLGFAQRGWVGRWLGGMPLP
jgi:hypothetical protein